MKYRKLPVTIEAEKFTGTNENLLKLREFTGDNSLCVVGESIVIKTLEGNIYATIGDYIIKGIKGEFYPCKPDIFNETYEEVEDEES